MKSFIETIILLAIAFILVKAFLWFIGFLLFTMYEVIATGAVFLFIYVVYKGLRKLNGKD